MEPILAGDALLRELFALAGVACRQAQHEKPRVGPGRKPLIADWEIATLIAIAVASRRKSKSAQYRYLCSKLTLLLHLGISRFPSRTTYFDRYRRASGILQQAVQIEGRLAVRRGWASARIAAVDKSLIAAQGPPRHQRKGRKATVKRADNEAGWGKSEHDGWVYGYGYEAVVSAGNSGPVWPLLASVESANCKETISFRDKVAKLPRSTMFVLADRGYDADDLCEAIEWTADGNRTGRRFVCPQIQRANARRTPRRIWKQSAHRRRRREHREARNLYLQSQTGQKIYARRRETSEPFNSWLKERFELQHHVWHRGLANNRTQILAAVFVYQLLLHQNRRHRKKDGSISWILDAL
jgi:hypothetical protein